ncbi:hypothetical protein HYDPIDRAFT_120172 [Hydnomerulius pinastri MD-312]|uniref:GED domain-containing protein n=1 Tax=Hydnomerulius pinastri MD-312 TaxID=994086 RepID=A0A0C9UY08_9AGAM|nr:hypothetical protein HYDPIDRAFT_120172 [Hydnomerulius pinastri MD-312]
MTIPFGATITDKSHVDIWLRRAQAAILNPDIPSEQFHKKTITELRSLNSPRSLKFSRNVVSVSIEDPDATDLSFVDLPGLMQNEEQEVIDLVRDLVVTYTKRQNTIILTTIPMSDDMENQQSVRLAKEADPEGERTIGILTKPDTLGEGAISAKKRWLDVIEGREHRLKHGYYCVRLPDDSQRASRLSRAALHKLAAEYFETTSPWSDVTERGRFGIPGFVLDISVLLIKHIEKVLPQLKLDAERLLTTCLERIAALPAPLTTDPQIEVLGRISAFSDAFKGTVSGTSSDKSLAQRNRALYALFKRDIRGTAPDFRPFHPPEEYEPFDDLEREKTLSERDPNVQTMGVYQVRKTIKESIAWELPNNIPYEAKTRLISQSTCLWTAPAERCLSAANDVLDEVIEGLIEVHFGRFKVLQNLIVGLIQKDIEKCKSQAHIAVKENLEIEFTPKYTQNTHYLQSLREKWLCRYKMGRRKAQEYKLPARAQKYKPPAKTPGYGHPTKVKEHKLPAKVQEYKLPADNAPSMECQWDDFLEENQPSQPPPVIYSHFQPVPSRPVESSPESLALDYLSRAGYKGLSIDDLARLLPLDEFEDELIVMADVRAYFQVAYKRIIDHIPLTIEHSLHQALAERLSASLLQGLLADAASRGDFAGRMKELVSEDPAIAVKRDNLQAERSSLLDIRRKLMNFT